MSRSFSDAFLIVTPGITIKDRLRVLKPQDPQNIYQQLDLVPRDMMDALLKARIVITNYHFVHAQGDGAGLQAQPTNSRRT